MIAYSLLPDRFEDGRHLAIEAGLAAVGYKVVRQDVSVPRIGPDDVCVTWNAYGTSGAIADKAKAQGGRAIVCEEAYLREIGGEKYFAVAINGHNGSGTWKHGGPERWASWDTTISPWRKTGEHVLVCGQRGFGYNAMAMPNDWPDRVLARLRETTDRPIWFRAHPKRRAVMPSAEYDRVLDWSEPLEAHLANCWAVVVWGSGCATHALLGGVPAFFEAPHIVTEGAAERGLGNINNPLYPDRLPVMERMAWAQWSMSELRSGAAFWHLLQS